MRGDGDGWVFDRENGARYWGVHGAAGLLLRAPVGGSGRAVLLQHRALWSHQGGTWALPGGARDSHETAADTAVREAGEEAGIAPSDVRVRGEVVTHTTTVGWTYTTVIAEAATALTTVGNIESTELRWVDEDEVTGLKLHPAFEKAWPVLRGHLSEL